MSRIGERVWISWGAILETKASGTGMTVLPSMLRELPLPPSLPRSLCGHVPALFANPSTPITPLSTLALQAFSRLSPMLASSQRPRLIDLPLWPALPVVLLLPALTQCLAPEPGSRERTCSQLSLTYGHTDNSGGRLRITKTKKPGELSSSDDSDQEQAPRGGRRRHRMSFLKKKQRGRPIESEESRGSRLRRMLQLNKALNRLRGRFGKWQKKRKQMIREKHMQDRLARLTHGSDTLSDTTPAREAGAEPVSGADLFTDPAGHTRHSSGQSFRDGGVDGSHRGASAEPVDRAQWRIKRKLKTHIRKAQRGHQMAIDQQASRDAHIARQQQRRGKGPRRKQMPKLFKLSMARQLKQKDLALGTNTDLYDDSAHEAKRETDISHISEPLDSDALQASEKGTRTTFLGVWLLLSSLGMTSFPALPFHASRLHSTMPHTSRMPDSLPDLDDDPALGLSLLLGVDIGSPPRVFSWVTFSKILSRVMNALSFVFPSLTMSRATLPLLEDLATMPLVRRWVVSVRKSNVALWLPHQLCPEPFVTFRQLGLYLQRVTGLPPKDLKTMDPPRILFAIALSDLEVARARGGTVKGLLLPAADPALRDTELDRLVPSIADRAFSAFLEHAAMLGRSGSRDLLLLDSCQYLLAAACHRLDNVRTAALKCIARLLGAFPSLLWDRNSLQTLYNVIEVLASQALRVAVGERRGRGRVVVLETSGYEVDVVGNQSKALEVFDDILHVARAWLGLASRLATAEVRVLVQDYISRLNIASARLGKGMADPWGPKPSMAGNRQGGGGGKGGRGHQRSEGDVSGLTTNGRLAQSSARTHAELAAVLSGLTVDLFAVAGVAGGVSSTLSEVSSLGKPMVELRAADGVSLREEVDQGSVSPHPIPPSQAISASALSPTSIVLSTRAATFSTTLERRAHFLGQVEGMYVFWRLRKQRDNLLSPTAKALPPETPLFHRARTEEESASPSIAKERFLNVMKRDSIHRLNKLLKMYRRLARIDQQFTHGSPYSVTPTHSHTLTSRGGNAEDETILPSGLTYVEDDERDEELLWELLGLVTGSKREEETMMSSKPGALPSQQSRKSVNGFDKKRTSIADAKLRREKVAEKMMQILDGQVETELTMIRGGEGGRRRVSLMDIPASTSWAREEPSPTKRRISVASITDRHRRSTSEVILSSLTGPSTFKPTSESIVSSASRRLLFSGPRSSRHREKYAIPTIHFSALVTLVVSLWRFARTVRQKRRREFTEVSSHEREGVDELELSASPLSLPSRRLGSCPLLGSPSALSLPLLVFITPSSFFLLVPLLLPLVRYYHLLVFSFSFAASVSPCMSMFPPL